jgi:hypothetical protein
VAAELVAILDVVVNEREVVDQLHCNSRGERPFGFTPDRLARPERQRGADPLACGIVRGVSLGVRVAEVVCGHLPQQPLGAGSRFPQFSIEKIAMPVEKRRLPFSRRRRIEVEDAFRHWASPYRKLSTS